MTERNCSGRTDVFRDEGVEEEDEEEESCDSLEEGSSFLRRGGGMIESGIH